MSDNGNIIITRTINSTNPNESFINGIHLKTVAGMLKIFELVTNANLFLFMFPHSRPLMMLIFVFNF